MMGDMMLCEELVEIGDRGLLIGDERRDGRLVDDERGRWR